MLDGPRFIGPFHRAHTEIAQALITAGADLQTDKYGYTPLHLAALHGHTDIAQALITAGADLNLRNGNGNIPLHSAALHGHTEIAQALITAGVDVEYKE